MLLQQAGLITLKPEAVKNHTATPLDVVTNPKKLKLVALDAAQLPRSLDDLTIASINNDYAEKAGLSLNKDAVIKRIAEEPVRQPDRRAPRRQGQALGQAPRGRLPVAGGEELHRDPVQKACSLAGVLISGLAPSPRGERRNTGALPGWLADREKMPGFPEHSQDTPWTQNRSTKSAQCSRT